MNKKDIAKFITIVTTPAIVTTAFITYSFYTLSLNNDIFIQTYFVVLLFTIILPVIFILFLLNRKKISNFHIKKREERVLPFAFTFLSGGVALVIIKQLEINPELFRLIIIFYLMAVGYIFLTFSIYKISGHALVLTATIIALAVFFNIDFIYLIFLLIPVGWSRVYLGEHTLKEFLSGTAYALVSFYFLNLII